jgi:phosphopantothenoylcysteine decarboxylase/phosphopantothenate--cysteine ligase
MAKAATGLADDLLSTLLLSFTGPIVFAPAMNSAMWEKRPVQRNIETLRADGHHIIDPQTGWQSCRRSGKGRMGEPADIQATITRLLASKK